MIRRSARSAGAGLAVVLALSAAGLATAHGPDPTLSGGAYPQNQVLTFDWRSGAKPPAAHRTAILAAAEDVTKSRASKAATFSRTSGAPSLIGYGAGATCGPNGIACFSRSVADKRFTMWFRPQGHVFDWGTLKWCQSYATPPKGCYDVENIALDEFGHIEGLGHHANYADERDYLDAVVQTFSRTKPKDGWNAHKLGRCDVATLQKLYDVTAATKISTCLNIPTKITLAPNFTRVASGGTVTLTATLRMADDPAYGKLRNNAVTKRTVTLQRRPAGGSGWTAVGAMSPGSAGTYTTSIKLTAATDFRAVFAAPSDEGLKGATSPVVTVTVSSCTTSPCPVSTTAE